MDLVMPPMPFSTVFVPKQGEAHLYTPPDMTNYGSNTRVDLPIGVVQVIVTWRGLDALAIRHYTGPGSGDWETVALIPRTTSAESRSTGVLTLPSDKPHQLAIVIHPSSTSWNPTTLSKGYVAGVQVMPMGTAADITGGGSMLRVDNSVGTRVLLGDSMIHGDTGWRNVAGLDWPYERLELSRISRTNDTVTLMLQYIHPPAITEGTLANMLPNGFRPAYHANFTIDRLGTSGEHAYFGVYSSGAIQTRKGQTGGSWSYLHALWTTRESWPTTLPGTAV